MDRQLIYSGQVPLETDLLNTNKNVMLALGFLAQDLLGTATVFSGLACTQTLVATMSVLIAPGRVYSSQNVDNTAYSSLAADTTHQVIKQGISLNSVTLACPAPVTAGFSINYLIEAAFQEADGNLVTLPYYNSANPAQAFSGPANSGTPQATVRQGNIVFVAKPGIAAATGTQTTPAPDAGYTGLYVVSVAQGQTTITSSSIAVLAGAPLYTGAVTQTTGSFTPVYSGFAASGPAGLAYWSVQRNMATIIFPASLATSNAVTMSFNNLPAVLQPSRVFWVPCVGLTTNGLNLAGMAYFAGGNIVNFGSAVGSTLADAQNAFANSGQKGFQNGGAIVYPLS